MFENIFTAKQEKNPEIIKENFENEEGKVVNEAVSFLEKIEPEKYKNKSVNLLLALSLFIGASTAFAGEQKTDKELPDMGEAQILKKQDKKNSKNQIANFDIKKIIPKIEISMGGRMENLKPFNAEEISFEGQGKSNFYQETSEKEFFYDHIVFNQVVGMSENAEEFFNNMSSLGAQLNDRQKASVLQNIGLVLGETYNMDMLAKNEHIEIADDASFQALKARYFNEGSKIRSGICGNIHAFLTKTAMSMGIEAWLQSGETPGGRHIWSGMVLGEGEQKQIVFLDYGKLVPTGTLNYKDALGIMEREHKAISIFTNFAENKDGVFRVKSRAVDVIERASGVIGSMNILEQNFKNNEIIKNDSGVEVRLTPEIKEIKLTSKMLGLSFFKFDDVNNNPYQSMEDMSALQASYRTVNDLKSLSADLRATVLHMNIKDLYGETTAENDLITRVAFEYLDKKQLTKSQYGEFVANFGATLEGAISVPLGRRENKKTDYIAGAGEGAIGAGLIYLDPNDIGKFYVRAEEVATITSSDMVDIQFIAQKAQEKFIVGADVKVFEGQVLNIEAARSNLSWGEARSIKSGLTGGKLNFGMGYEKVDSEQTRILPSTEKSKLELGYNGGPKWRVDVIGSKTKEQYKDAKSNDIYTAEVKLRMFLW